MSPNTCRKLQADVVIAGSGPGGATVAKELSRKGKKVIVCEAGKRHNWFGYTLSCINMTDQKGMTFSKEGSWVIAGKSLGGGSAVYGGLATKPPEVFKEKYGIDLDKEVKEFYDEVPIKPLPDEHIGPASRKIMEAARRLGLDWKPVDRLIRPEKCPPHCDKCLTGCNKGGKWTAREFVDDAVEHGASLHLNTEVERVLTENGNAIGVRAWDSDGPIEILADTVVLSAGGFGTPRILQRSGVDDAGRGFAVDFGRYVVGVSPDRLSKGEIPASTGVDLSDEEGFSIYTATPKPLMHAALMGLSGYRAWGKLPSVLRRRRAMGVLFMTRDALQGRVNVDGSFTKSIDEDCWTRINKATALSEQVLEEAGVRRKDITPLKIFAAHQVAAVRIGGVLDNNCETPIKNCYCMDATVFPEETGTAPVVTIVAFAKRLAKHLTV